ncbi:MAG: hypothetical protein NTX25_04540 [Proteobacteria bacterium]|nr:hypothetical protein [Pseudomonadota bacterium]
MKRLARMFIINSKSNGLEILGFLALFIAGFSVEARADLQSIDKKLR